MCANGRYVGASTIGYLIGLRPDDRPYNGLSLTHGNTQVVTLAPSLVMKLRAVFSRRFTKSRLWDVVREHGCTVFNLLGGMATAIYTEPQKLNDADNTVRLVISGGMPAALWRAFEQRFNLKVLERYAAVEGGLAINPIGVGPIGSFGKPPSNLEMKIVNEQADECTPKVVGELISRPTSGERVEVEYFENEEASQSKTRGGRLRSGDMCHSDIDGWFYLDFRKGGGLRHNGEIPKTPSEKPQERFLLDRFAPDGPRIYHQ